MTLPVVVPLFSFNGTENSRTNPYKQNRRATQIERLRGTAVFIGPFYGLSRPLWTCGITSKKRANFIAVHKEQ
ncbi:MULTISPECIES: hypothetical protein [unclassified Agrobacterium]|uniref:hypothetical protein n=1 Tax=unclassified Agrobacterium TaxID=2632611 RepID=UPI0024497EEC|nr:MULTISPECIES: hypothetical protein [unclassified Agrobacterium]MDH0612796.1 hypothetical protein [Agrobacterium sp. GD03872]MDH0694660.1 hypothetical protein [Agrobacterium sp. GD03871]MDH1057942.1 hypothetical protein [Agrobacterium sp. GD03992]MDH2209231.1 hypothetical protein [Agrobacterium sp. GD03643]MDH2218722.1 hypothetical protein [Agrobacterium sp. GD03638]